MVSSMVNVGFNQLKDREKWKWLLNHGMAIVFIGISKHKKLILVLKMKLKCLLKQCGELQNWQDLLFMNNM